LTQKDRRKTMDLLYSLSGGEFGGAKEKSGRHSEVREELASSEGHVGTAQVQGTATIPTVNVETSSKRIKMFSGSTKPANGELDFKHWKRAADRILEDVDLTVSQKRRIILQSLTGHAEDSIDLHRGLPCAELIEILDKIYGDTVDGGDLLADFFQMLQGVNESAGEYLNRLFLHLSEVIKHDGLKMQDLPKALLRQFVRGTSDESLLIKLQLDSKLDNPPSFPELFSLIRTKESRRTERRLRHKKIAKAHSVISSVTDASEKSIKDPVVPIATKSLEYETLHNEIVGLKQQLQGLRLGTGCESEKSPKFYFCYRCGVDGHYASTCRNKPNNKLVREKTEARRNNPKPSIPGQGN